uniref:Pyrin domain-containing protein n=1 Tax=Kryptolebias marmoratus TaxID=37003 RepID=A0A3Q3GIR5_KRYMA
MLSVPAVHKIIINKTLNELKSEEFEDFKFSLKQTSDIPTSQLENATRRETAELLVQNYPQGAVDFTVQTLKGIQRNDLATRLSQNVQETNWIRTLRL